MSSAAEIPTQPRVALTIAGSDNSAGAGAQADLKTFTAHGVYGLTALTCVVAEVPGKVSRIQPIDLDVVREQIALSLAAFPVAATKTGMLYSREIIEAVAEIYARLPAAARPPLVVDPVMVATSGAPLLKAEGVRAYQETLFPLAALVTPNVDEARVLLGDASDGPISGLAVLREAGTELAVRHGVPFLMKGGHLVQNGSEAEAVDLLVFPDGRAVEEFRAPFTAGVATHGTGCTYAAAIAANLARGSSLAPAVAHAKNYVTRAIAQHFRWSRPDNGAPVDALAHFERV